MIGIDYSYSSPAICITDNGHSTWYYLNSVKKRIVENPTVGLYGTLLPSIDDDTLKFDFISDWVIDIVLQHPHQDINIEGYAMNAMGRTFQIGENTGLLKYKLMQSGRAFNMIPPTAIKKFATGKGNATKPMMEVVFRKHHSFDFRELTHQPAGAENPSSDLIDAFFISTYRSVRPTV